MNLLQQSATPSRTLLLLAVLVVLSRLPFIWTGYGADADAWRVARAADTLWRSGQYEPSRLPGYPLHEILLAPIVPAGGSPLSNSLTVAASLLALFAWYHVAARAIRFPLLSTIGLAFLPLFWISSDSTTDYVWSLLFILLSLRSLFDKRILLGGVCLGLAVGFRPSNLVAILPLLAFLLLQERSPRKATVFIAATLATSVIAFSPLLLRYGPAGWVSETLSETSDISFTWSQRIQFFAYRSLYSLGPLAGIYGAGLLVLRQEILLKAIRSRDPILVSSLVAVATYTLLYFIVPLERFYLLPAVPFLLIVMERLATRNQFLIFVCCLISFAFVNPDIIMHKDIVGTPGLNVHWGLVVEDYHKRTELLEDRERIAGVQLQGKALIMTGGGEAFWFQNEAVLPDTSSCWRNVAAVVSTHVRNPDLHFVAMLSREELVTFRSMGFTVYCLAAPQQFIERTTGLEMQDEGIPIIDHRRAR